MRVNRKVIIGALSIPIILLLGCTSLYPPPNKGWVQVDASPYRTTILCDADTITSEFIQCIIKDTKTGDFKPYKFNDSTSINVMAQGIKSDIRTHSSVISTN